MVEEKKNYHNHHFFFLQYSYWIEPSQIFQTADLMVSPEKLAEFVKLMDSTDMKYATYIENVQNLIEQEQSRSEVSSTEFNWTRYQPLEQINNWLYNISTVYPDIVRIYAYIQYFLINVSLKSNLLHQSFDGYRTNITSVGFILSRIADLEIS